MHEGPSPSGSVEARTYAEQIRLLYVQSRSGLVSTLLVGVVFITVLAPSSSIPRIALWVCAFLAVAFGRDLLVRAYLRARAPEPARWSRMFAVGSAAQGLSWGLGAVLLFPEGMRQAFVFFLMAGMTAGAVSFLAFAYVSYVVYVVGTIVPVVVLLFIRGDGVAVSMAITLLIYVGAVLGAGRRVHKALIDALRLRFQNSDLLEAVRASERRLAMHVERAPLAVIRWRPRFVVEEWNQAAERIFGHPRAEAIGARAGALLGAGVDYDALWNSVLASNEGIELSLEHVAKGGRRVACDWYHTPLVEADGGVIGVASIAHDVTEQREVERMKGDFIATVSHELRTPLTAIQGAVDLLVGGVAGVLPETAQDLAVTAASNATRLRKLVDDLLDFEKLTSATMTLARRRTLLVPLVDEVIACAAPFAQKYDVRIERLPAPDAELLVETDPDRLGQVLTNLLSNAAKFSQPGGVIAVGVDAQDGRAVLSVRDRGVGIPEAFHDRIFQKFSQVDSSDSRAKGGTGLGLSISKAIVEKLGGEISFESTLGAGTTFRVSIPQATRR
jgi:PAS domain S-box-containing protein